ncbi:MAG: hypothetical protein K2J20_06930 [Bacilli bacterium]|nr:hypothetical protein [Bacilli bacterium]
MHNFLVECCVDELILTIKSSNKIITEMDKLARELPEYEIINEIPGVGKKITSRVMAGIEMQAVS